jgi:hypothetical protein
MIVYLANKTQFRADTHKGRSQADPFVIATAVCLGADAVVVTGEKRRGNLAIPKIPDVCDAIRPDHEGSMGGRFDSVHGLSMDIGGRIPPLLGDGAPLGRRN